MQSPMYAQQQLACLMELRQYQQQQQGFVRRPDISTSPSTALYYAATPNQTLHCSTRPPSKAFTIDAILGLHSHQAGNADLCRNKTKTVGIVASLAAACRRSAVQAALSSAQQINSAGGNAECGKPSENNKTSMKSHHQQQPQGGKSKRVRTIFTPEQLERLEAEFERQQYMVGPERLYLASALHLTEAQVKVWFQNRRIKWRKQHLEIQQQRLAALKQQQQQHMQLGTEDESLSETSSVSETPD